MSRASRFGGAIGSLSNRRTWADLTGDGICLDAEGAVWTTDVVPDDKGVCLRVREGGEDGRTLFMVAQKWFGPDQMDDLIQAKTGQIVTARVSVPHAGWP